MISAAQAAEAAQGMLDDLEANGATPLAIVAMVRHHRGWLVTFNSVKYIETARFTDLLGGNGPIVVHDDGGVTQVQFPEDAGSIIGPAI